MVADVYMG